MSDPGGGRGGGGVDVGASYIVPSRIVQAHMEILVRCI